MSDGGDGGRGDPRVWLAAERTLLAWVRTGLAMMGLGFVVARAGVLLPPADRAAGPGEWLGVGLVAAGAAVNLLAVAGHRRVIRDVERAGGGRPPHRSLGVPVAVALAALGAALVGALVG